MGRVWRKEAQRIGEGAERDKTLAIWREGHNLLSIGFSGPGMIPSVERILWVEKGGCVWDERWVLCLAKEKWAKAIVWVCCANHQP